MKRIFNFPAMLFAAALVTSLGSCTEEFEYSGAKVEGEQVYFSSELPSTVNLSQDESSVQIPVNRINSEGTLTVDLDVTVSADSKVISDALAALSGISPDDLTDEQRAQALPHVAALKAAFGAILPDISFFRYPASAQ